LRFNISVFLQTKCWCAWHRIRRDPIRRHGATGWQRCECMRPQCLQQSQASGFGRRRGAFGAFHIARVEIGCGPSCCQHSNGWCRWPPESSLDRHGVGDSSRTAFQRCDILPSTRHYKPQQVYAQTRFDVPDVEAHIQALAARRSIASPFPRAAGRTSNSIPRYNCRFHTAVCRRIKISRTAKETSCNAIACDGSLRAHLPGASDAENTAPYGANSR